MSSQLTIFYYNQHTQHKIITHITIIYNFENVLYLELIKV